LLDVVEEQILSLLCVWPGRTPDVIMGALVLRKEALDLALQELEGKRFVSVICTRDGDPKNTNPELRYPSSKNCGFSSFPRAPAASYI